jgi:hypothetical protein
MPKKYMDYSEFYLSLKKNTDKCYEALLRGRMDEAYVYSMQCIADARLMSNVILDKKNPPSA